MTETMKVVLPFATMRVVSESKPLRVVTGGQGPAGAEGPQGPPGTGDVNGPASATAGNVAIFDDETGKLITDSGVALGDLASLDTVGTAQVDDDAVTYAKMQNISATSRILGRATAGAGNPEELTLSQMLDFIGSAAQGDILFRGSTGWARLAAGTSGQFLQTQGGGANPVWAQGGGGLGANQTWQDLSASRAVNTSYQNTEGTPIEIAVVFSGANSENRLQVSSDNATWFDVALASGNQFEMSGSAVIPDDYYYRLQRTSGAATTIHSWSELR